MVLVKPRWIALVAGLLCVNDGAARHFQDAQKALHAVDSGGSHNPFNDDLAEFVNDVMNRWKIPGLSVAVIDGDDTYMEGYGYATLPDIKATPETLYFAGSTSKAFAAATLAHLIDSKNYSALAHGWDTPISSLIRDDFVLQDPWATAHLTLDDAASHRTGMPRHDLAWPRSHGDGSTITTAEHVRALRHLKPSAPPRTTWQYCNFMYVVLGHVVEVLTRQWLGDAIRAAIWAPLGMKATFGDTRDAEAAPEHLAAGYYWDEERASFREMRVDSTRESGGAGLVISTVADYSKWARCLLEEAAPFSASTHRDMRRPRMLTGSKEGGKMGEGDMTYGLAWMKKTYHGEVVYKHGGTELAYSTQVYWVPRLRYAVIAMANTGVANSAEDEVVWRLIEDKLQVPKSQRYKLTSSLEESMKELKKALDGSEADFYHDRPQTPLPSSLTDEQIAGDYFDPGYGRLHIVETQVDGERMLVANRTEAIFPFEMRFAHVTGNYWLVDLFESDTRSVIGKWGGEFKIGVDGQAAGLEIQLTPPSAEINEGTVWFKRT